ncbi:MAG TPA: signal peptidase II [Rhizobiaceae bacterium]|nr:signal peptidase II [Rhizobiaceae bacterium]
MRLATFLRYCGVMLIAVALDQWIKYLVETRLEFQQQIDLLPFLALFRTYNTGVAFSMFSFVGDKGLVLLALVVIAFVLYLAVRTNANQWVARLGFALIIGGAAGNIIDRIAYGHVVDYILFHTPSWSFAVFNLADAFITIGAGLVILEEIISWWSDRKRVASTDD